MALAGNTGDHPRCNVLCANSEACTRHSNVRTCAGDSNPGPADGYRYHADAADGYRYHADAAHRHSGSTDGDSQAPHANTYPTNSNVHTAHSDARPTDACPTVSYAGDLCGSGRRYFERNRQGVRS